MDGCSDISLVFYIQVGKKARMKFGMKHSGNPALLERIRNYYSVRTLEFLPETSD